MRLNGTDLTLSATDLSNFLGCRHRTALDLSVAYGNRPRNPKRVDPLLQILFDRGLEHEKRYVESLRESGRKTVDLTSLRNDPTHVQRTIDAMRSGADVIVQGALSDGRWFGLPDIMQRIEVPSSLGAWSYEIADTKLARETRAGTILQLGLYSEMLRLVQERSPEYFHVITPDPLNPKHTYRVSDYAAYFRWMRAQMRDNIALGADDLALANYPEPVDHCDICPWCRACRLRWIADDHLSLVAGITRNQRRELESNHITTLAELAAMPLPLQFKPSRGSADSYERIREQARLQFEARAKAPPPPHKLREIVEGMGLGRLPEPSPGDIFLDLEGDPFAAEGGREYLFGLITVGDDGQPVYQSFWGMTEREERDAFESVMDVIADALEKHPGMHVYHYAPYEPSAFKRLMGRYATKEDELDRMLRAGRFVDLYHVVRQALIAGVERYSIKNLEVFYGYARDVDLAIANRHLRVMEKGLELQSPEIIPQEVRDAVEGYNRDDCVSTLRLRDWLEGLRAQVISSGVMIARPVMEDGAPSEGVDERAQRVEALRARFIAGMSDLESERSPEEQARWLIAYMLDFHRREEKSSWWEYFRLRDLPEEELFDEPDALAGLEFTGHRSPVISEKTGKPTKSVIDRYRFPAQEMEIDRGDGLKLMNSGDTFGEVVGIDRHSRTIDICKGPSRAEIHPTSVFAHSYVSTAEQERALLRLGERVAAAGTVDDTHDPVLGIAATLLLRKPPRLVSGEFTAPAPEDVSEYAAKIAGKLNATVLAIQGPPGAGKTYTGARMIRELVAQGKRVGVTANSHKVILNLLRAVAEADGPALSLMHKDKPAKHPEVTHIEFIDDNAAALEAIVSGKAQVFGGTSWLWAREEFANSVDVLFVDEAGQMSLPNVLAVSSAADSLVLLGDPQQLDQPQKGSHPDGVNVSALQQVLGDHQTMPPERGLFLPETWRLHPDLCAFTSELFYEGRLSSRSGLDRQQLEGSTSMDGSGLWFVEVDHDGNRNFSSEEVHAVTDLITQLVASGTRWIDRNGQERVLTTHDILVVAPYNAQVTRLTEALDSADVRVGTVDKFQGQEAPVVIYSMATSRPEDAPRGMEFLYNPNRLNVATSRARCAAILVASPRLFEPDCTTPRQMKLANAFCRYREIARTISNHPF